MFPKSFDYSSPLTLLQALKLLAYGDVEVKVLAGGQSLIPAMKLRNLALKSVVDISGIKELNYIQKGKDALRIGALTTTATIEYNSELSNTLPILPETASQIADPLVRNLGTVGGDLCYGDPANDFPASMIALNAALTLINQKGSRTVPADAFFLGAFKTDVKPDEVLTEVTIPLRNGKAGGAYRKVRKGSGGFTIAGVAANLSVDEGNRILDCSLGLTAVDVKPVKATEAAQVLIGKTLEESGLEEAAELAVNVSKPGSDINASAEYRRKALRLLVKDAIEAAYRRAVMGGYGKS